MEKSDDLGFIDINNDAWGYYNPTVEAARREAFELRQQIRMLTSELTTAKELLHTYFVKPDKCAFAARDIGEFLLDEKDCKTCNGTKVVDDGEINSSGGIDFENGPVQCVKDCPDCT